MSMQWIIRKPDTRTPEQREKDRLEKIEWQKQVKLQREKTNAENRIKMRKQIEEWAAKCKAQREERERKGIVSNRKVTPKTYNYKYDTDPLGYQTGDMYRDMSIRDRDDY